MHDAAYKLIFSRPRMVCDLLDGFAARGWSDALDFDTLTLLPTGLVSEDLQRREGDLVWRVRFRGDRWLYLVLLLEFQAAVDRAMPVRMLAYTALLYQRMIADGALRGNGELPPVLAGGRLQRPAAVDGAGRDDGPRGGGGARRWRRTSRRSGTIFWTGRGCPPGTRRRTTWCRRCWVWRGRAARRVRRRRCGRWTGLFGRRVTGT